MALILKTLSTLVILLLPWQLSAQGVGVVDTVFGHSGITHLAQTLPGMDSHAFLVEPDDHIWVLVRSNGNTELQRLNPDGDLDTTFGRKGHLPIPIQGKVSALQRTPDGAILLGGYEELDQKRDFVILRLMANGQPDPGFGYQGKALINFGGQDECRQLLIQPSGNILALGQTYRESWKDSDFAVAMLDSRGQLVESFGLRGRVLRNVAEYDSNEDALLMPSGHILLAGATRKSNFNAFCLIKLKPNGSLDTGFGQNGLVIKEVGLAHAFLKAIAIQKNGKILVAGHAKINPSHPGFDLVIMRLNPDGQADPDFGKNGMLVLDLGGTDYISDAFIQNDGRIILAGSANYKFMLLRLDPSGSPDPTFGQNGLRILKYGGLSADRPGKLAIQRDGSILFSGLRDSKICLTRLMGNPEFFTVSQPYQSTRSLDPDHLQPISHLALAGDLHVKAWVDPKEEPQYATRTIAREDLQYAPQRATKRTAGFSLGESLKVTLVWKPGTAETYFYLNGQFAGMTPLPEALKKEVSPSGD